MDDGHYHSATEPGIRPNLSVADFMEALAQLRDSVAPGQLSPSQIQELINSLPRLSEEDVVKLGHKDSMCSICFTQHLALLAEEEVALVMDSPAHPAEELGVTRLAQPWQCGHMFCRRDILKWIQDGHDSCPMCRRPLVQASTSEEPAAAQNVNSTRNERIDRSFLPIGFPAFDGIDVDTLLSRFGVPLDPTLLSGPLTNSARSRRDSQDDRNEFSGMYS